MTVTTGGFVAVTLNDVTPVGLCIATDVLFDAKRFLSGFGDNVVLRSKDGALAGPIGRMKRELNTSVGVQKFLDGYKAAIIGNIDRIISAATRYMKIDIRETERVVEGGKDLMGRVANASTFDELAALQPEFKRNVMLPVYGLFIKQSRRDGLVI
jgi:hypothetical protein